MHFLESHEIYPCPCCGYQVHKYPPGYHEVCPICGWEDELSQLRFVEMPGISNHVHLKRAQENFVEYGVSEKRNLGQGRQPVPGEKRDTDWRPIDLAKDNIEEPCSGIDYATSYPEDTTVLYYWRSTYWRRVVG